MSWEEVLKYARNGYEFMLPGWEGYFKWNYEVDKLEFINNEYRSFDNIDTTRTDYYYII